MAIFLWGGKKSHVFNIFILYNKVIKRNTPINIFKNIETVNILWFLSRNKNMKAILIPFYFQWDVLK